ncbi:MAG: lyase [Gemmatimonadetes bacterium]|nr:lyase [Gemmatimonadota bacterium]
MLIAAALLVPAGAPVPAAAQAGAAVPMQEWTVPWEKSRPRDPAVDAQGRIFFVGQVGNYVARLDPRTGDFEKFAIDAGTMPHNVVVDRRGFAWYSGNMNGMIGRLDPATGAITRYPMPDANVKDPHTLAFDPAGDIWFTAQNSNVVGKLTVSSGKVQLLALERPRSRPYGIVIDPHGRPWFCLFGTNRIGTVDPATMQVTEIAGPDSMYRPRRIAMTSDGRVWTVDYMRGMLVAYDPRTKQWKEWASPLGKASLPYAMTVDDRDRLWWVETGKQPNRLVGFDPATQQMLGATEVKSGGGTIRHMVFDRATGVIWFGTDNNTIGKAVVSPKPIS